MTKQRENKTLPLVSVGIPTYCRPNGLRRTLECITAQTYKNLQIIISDNNTPGDEIEKVVNEFARSDDRIEFYRQTENRGVFFNFNYVLEMAQGEYFMWAADDDEWSNTFIERAVDLLQKHESSVMSFCNISALDWSDGKKLTYSPNLSSPYLFQRLKAFLAMKEELLGKANLFYSLHRRKSLMEACKLDYYIKGEYAADCVVILRLLLVGSVNITDQALFRPSIFNNKLYDSGANQANRMSLSGFFSAALSGIVEERKKRKRYFVECKRLIKEANLSFYQYRVLRLQLAFREKKLILYHILRYPLLLAIPDLKRYVNRRAFQRKP
ncbi:MAG: glycosyltransferase family 2 protein [Chloroflexi bacterium]|nr:glycosyltransferase family 2 protein [Chloroflexota bacterium]